MRHPEVVTAQCWVWIRQPEVIMHQSWIRMPHPKVRMRHPELQTHKSYSIMWYSWSPLLQTELPRPEPAPNSNKNIKHIGIQIRQICDCLHKGNVWWRMPRKFCFSQVIIIEPKCYFLTLIERFHR